MPFRWTLCAAAIVAGCGLTTQNTVNGGSLDAAVDGISQGGRGVRDASADASIATGGDSGAGTAAGGSTGGSAGSGMAPDASASGGSIGGGGSGLGGGGNGGVGGNPRQCLGIVPGGPCERDTTCSCCSYGYSCVGAYCECGIQVSNDF